MLGPFYYGVRVRFANGRSETFKCETRDEARAMEKKLWSSERMDVSSADYVGRKVNWAWFTARVLRR